MKAIDAIERNHDTNSQYLIAALAVLGEAYLAEGSQDKVAPVLERASTISDADKAVTGGDQQDLLKLLVKLYRVNGRVSDAVEMEQRTSSIPTVAPATTGSIVSGSRRFNYPKEALLKELEGNTLARVSVTAGGLVKGVEISESSGSSWLDRATLDGFNYCKFKPTLVNEKAIQASYRLENVWNLNQYDPIKLTARDCPRNPSFRFPGESDSLVIAISLRIEVGVDGKPGRATVQTSSGNADTDGKVVNFAQSCHYHATIEHGKAVPNNAYIRDSEHRAALTRHAFISIELSTPYTSSTMTPLRVLPPVILNVGDARFPPISSQWTTGFSA